MTSGLPLETDIFRGGQHFSKVPEAEADDPFDCSALLPVVADWLEPIHRGEHTMGRFILRNNLYLMTALAVLVAAFVIWNWESIPILQRMVGLFFVALVMHLWEEQRIPGGFVELITEHLHFTADRHFGEIITIAYALVIAFVPLFFPHVAFLAMATMMLGIMEAVMHTAMIRMFKLPHLYSPGLATAVLLLLPIAIYTFIYVIRNDLMQPFSWLLAFLYMLLGLVVAQQIVIRMSGMKYTDFLKSVQAALKERKTSA